MQLTTLVILHPLFNFSIVEFIALLFEGQAQAVHAQYLRLLALIQHYLSSKIATRISSRYFVFDYFEKILRLDVIHCLPIKSFMFFRFGVRNYIVNKIILHRFSF